MTDANTERAEALAAVRERFDSRAAEYDELQTHRALAAGVSHFVALDGVATVLDVGTGTGLALRALRSRIRPDMRVRMIGADLSPGMLAVARAALPGAELIEGDATALPLPGDSVDLVLCVTAIHLFPDVAAALAEWHRLLRPGGRLVTATFATAHGTAHRHGHGHEAEPASPHDRFATTELLTAEIEPAGFRLTRTERWTDGSDEAIIAEFEPLPS